MVLSSHWLPSISLWFELSSSATLLIKFYFVGTFCEESSEGVGGIGETEGAGGRMKVLGEAKGVWVVLGGICKVVWWICDESVLFISLLNRLSTRTICLSKLYKMRNLNLLMLILQNTLQCYPFWICEIKIYLEVTLLW